MKFLFVLISYFTAVSAMAHVEPGTYKGVGAKGEECTMTAGATYFEGNARHPLRERIAITVGGVEVIVGHPPVIDSSKALVSFNHDLFQGLVPTNRGAQALEIQMEHSEEFEGPRSFIFMDNTWKNDTRVSVQCNNLKLVK